MTARNLGRATLDQHPINIECNTTRLELNPKKTNAPLAY